MRNEITQNYEFGYERAKKRERERINYFQKEIDSGSSIIIGHKRKIHSNLVHLSEPKNKNLSQ